ncbi:MAG: hypothetical protein V3W18_04500 [candidate division Zixibacteria bacterium]
MPSRKSNDIQLSALENAMQLFDEAAERLNIDKTLFEILIVITFSDILKVAFEYKCNMRIAVYMLANNRAGDVTMLRGIYA